MTSGPVSPVPRSDPARAGGEPGPWAFRAMWVLAPLALSPVVGGALEGRADAVRLVAAVLLWAGWVAALVAALVPRTVSLTVVRTLAAAAPAAALWAALADPGPLWWEGALGLTAGLLAAATALSPLLGDAFVDGSSYGRERRLALGVPVRLLPIVALAWGVLVAGVAAGPLLLAAEQWVAGTVALVVGWALAGAMGRALHGLSRRWMVFVPAGVVVHDPLGLADNLLLLRSGVRHVGLAPKGTDARDLTLGATGLICQIDLAEPAPISLRRGRGEVEAVTADRILVSPTRPGAFLAVASARRFPVRQVDADGGGSGAATPPPTTSSPS